MQNPTTETNPKETVSQEEMQQQETQQQNNDNKLLSPEASVLIQPRPRAHSDTGLEKQINPISIKTEQAIIDTIIALRNEGRTETTIKQVNYKLREIARNTIIDNPEEVKAYIATARNQITHEPLGEESRNKIAYAYDKYCQKQNIVWKKPNRGKNEPSRDFK